MPENLRQARPRRANSRDFSTRRDGRVVDGGGLENHCTGNRTGGSNPSPSATITSTVTLVGANERAAHVLEPIAPRRALHDQHVIARLERAGWHAERNFCAGSGGCLCQLATTEDFGTADAAKDHPI